MKKIILVPVLFLFMNNYDAMAVIGSGATGACSRQEMCVIDGGSVSGYDGNTVDFASNCATKGAVCYHNGGEGVAASSCNTCPTGYTRTAKTYSTTCGGFAINLEYYTCLKTCNASNCASDADWSAYGFGYQKRVKRSCSNTTTCSESAEYRCAPGYYGTTSNGASGCTQCTSEDGAAATSAGGTTARTGCYIPSGTAFSNTTGKGTFAGNSYYCN